VSTPSARQGERGVWKRARAWRVVLDAVRSAPAAPAAARRVALACVAFVALPALVALAALTSCRPAALEARAPQRMRVEAVAVPPLATIAVDASHAPIAELAPACGATIERARRPGTVAAGWRAAWDVATADTGLSDSMRPKTEREGRDVVCPKCGRGPAVNVIDGAHSASAFAILHRADGRVVLHRLGQVSDVECTYERSFEVTGNEVAHVSFWVVARDLGSGHADGEPCDGGEHDDPSCSLTCVRTGRTVKHLFLDRATGDALLEITLDRARGEPERLAITEDDGMVRVRGEGCDATVPLR
jgi:hypothetical protein